FGGPVSRRPVILSPGVARGAEGTYLPGFGRFETVEELASSGPFAVYSARPAGEAGPPVFAVKVYRTSDMFADADVVEREAAAFLEASKLQQSLPAGSLNEAKGH